MSDHLNTEQTLALLLRGLPDKPVYIVTLDDVLAVHSVVFCRETASTIILAVPVSDPTAKAPRRTESGIEPEQRVDQEL
jgi:hypothetical protein